jgi:predicted RNA-binding protein YlxR (DUF448 family)
LTQISIKLNQIKPYKPKYALRKCIATGESEDRDGLIRFVLDPFGQLTPDFSEKLPGKGMWICSCYKMISLAVQKELFSKSARKKVLIPEKFISYIETGLVERAISSLGLARRAGRIIAGHAKVGNALRQGKVLMRIEAKDGAADGRGKLNRIRPNVPILESVSSKELAKAFDREHIIHLAVLINNHSGKGLEQRLKRDFGRLERFRKTNLDTRLENVAYGCIETIV